MLSVTPCGLEEPRPDECKQDIVAWRSSLYAAFGALAAASRELGARLQDTGTCKVSTEFASGRVLGEFGKLAIVAGKASARSAFKVGLEWTKP